MATLWRIEDLSTSLGQEIRAYVREQRTLWRQIPYLALLADGNGGFSEAYRCAYKSGMWTAQASPDNIILIDCDSGELVTYNGSRYVLAGDAWVVPFWKATEEIDAAMIIAELNDERRRRSSKYRQGPRAAWRQKIIDEHALTPIFRRKEPLLVR